MKPISELKILVSALPPRSHFMPTETIKENKFYWVDRLSGRVRIISKIRDPWNAGSVIVHVKFNTASDGTDSEYVERLNLIVFQGHCLGVLKGEIERVEVEASFPHILKPSLGFAAFPLPKLEVEVSGSRWLIYSFLSTVSLESGSVSVEALKAKFKPSPDPKPEPQSKPENERTDRSAERSLCVGSAAKSTQSKHRKSREPNQSTNGASLINEGTDNDTRVKEAIKAVQEAVETLKQKYPEWNTFGIRTKIQCLQEETLRKRGVAMSTQTLYREWMIVHWKN